MKYLGDYAEDYAALNFKFSTHKADGTPITLAGTPAISVYKANSTTQSTAGLALTVDFDSVTGMHNVLIDLSADAFYATGNDYAVVVTTGTVDSVSVVGTVLAHFSIQNRYNKVDVLSISGDATAADNLEAACDGGTFNVGGGAVVAASVTGAVGSVTGAVGSVTGAVGSVTGAVGSVTAAVVLPTGTGAGQIALSSGTVTVGTNNDKTGYTASTVSDKTGYALTSAYDPAKTASQFVAASDTVTLKSGTHTGAVIPTTTAVTNAVVLPVGTGSGQIALSSGAVTVGTNNDKTGYTASTVSDKTGYALSGTQAFDLTGDITGDLSGSVGSVAGDVGGKVLGGGAGTISGTGVRAVDASGNAVAPASTALSNAVWTNAKAAFLDQAVSAAGSLTSSERNSTADAILARVLAAESYAADGAVPTLSQVLYMLWSAIGDFSISGTTLTCKKLDGTTTSMTFTLDDASAPTSRTRSR